MEVWSWGAGADGQLATGLLADSLLPQRVPALENTGVREMACGGAHAVAVLGGRVTFTWGRGSSGQLGHNSNDSVSLPKLVYSLHDVKIRSVAAGWSHTAFVSESGSLYTCGDGAYGQLGLGDLKARSLPSLVTGLGSMAACMTACGMRHTLVLMKMLESGETAVWAFGACKRGQLGVFPLVENGGENVESWQVQAKQVGRVCHPRRLSSLDELTVESVAANGDHSAALTVLGDLFIWGRGYDNHADIPVPARAQSNLQFAQVALGWSHGLGLCRDQVIFSWGSNDRGQLGCHEHFQGLPHNGSRDVLGCERLSQDGSTRRARRSFSSQVACPEFRQVETPAGAKSIWVAAGAEHSAAIIENRAVMTWGWGEHGQLGVGTDCDQKIPQQLALPLCRDHIRSRVVCGSGFTFLFRDVPPADSHETSATAEQMSTQDKLQ